MSAPAASEASPSQIAAASSPAAIFADRFGTGILTMKKTAIWTISAITLQIRQSTILAEWAMALNHRQHEAEQAEAERDGGRRIVVADQLEFVVRRDAGVDEEVGDDGNDGRAEIEQERRQSGQ